MIYLDIFIVLIIIALCFLVKDYQKILNISSIITIILGYIIIFLSFTISIIIKNNLSFINTSKISSVITGKLTNRGLIFILVGGIELIIYIIIKLKRRIIKQ